MGMMMAVVVLVATVVEWVLLVVLVVVLAIVLAVVVVVVFGPKQPPTGATMSYCYVRNYGTGLIYREWEFQRGTLHYCYWRRNGHFQIVAIPELVSKSCLFLFSFLLRIREFPSKSSSPLPAPSSRTDSYAILDATSTSTNPALPPGTPLPASTR